MRRRNYIPEMPWTTPNGCVYNSGDYAAMLRDGQGACQLESWMEMRKELRAQGRVLEIGIGTALMSRTNDFVNQLSSTESLDFREIPKRPMSAVAVMVAARSLSDQYSKAKATRPSQRRWSRASLEFRKIWFVLRLALTPTARPIRATLAPIQANSR